MKKLSSKLPHSKYTVLNVDESELRSRLYEMGIFPNQLISLIRKAPFGDPLLVEIDDQLVMLRSEEASLITVQEI